MQIIFPDTPIKGSRDAYIKTCIATFHAIKNNHNLKDYQEYVLDFIKDYLDMDYKEFKKQAIEEMNKDIK